ncbi:hypothetical protein L9F63_021792, partial [Diploptera punctata]
FLSNILGTNHYRIISFNTLPTNHYPVQILNQKYLIVQPIRSIGRIDLSTDFSSADCVE